MTPLVGQSYGRWTVIGDLGRATGTRYMRCLCECGAVRRVAATSLTQRRSSSCGCLAKEVTSARTKARLGVEGHARDRSPEYSSWGAMLARCYNKNAANFHKYGGRGVGVCSRWRDSFMAFLNDLGPRPPGTSLDRIDGRLGYVVGNCRWATPLEQRHNRIPMARAKKPKQGALL